MANRKPMRSAEKRKPLVAVIPGISVLEFIRNKKKPLGVQTDQGLSDAAMILRIARTTGGHSLAKCNPRGRSLRPRPGAAAPGGTLILERYLTDIAARK